MEGLEFSKSDSSLSGGTEGNKTASPKRDRHPSSNNNGYYGRNFHKGEVDQADDAKDSSFSCESKKISRTKTKRQAVIVETVNEDGDSDDGLAQEDDTPQKAASLVISCMPQTQEQAIQLGMTILFSCFVAGAVLSFLAVSKEFRFVMAVVWILLLFLFGLFIYFIQSGALEQTSRGREGRVFHPIIHAAAQMIVDEINNFQQDWKEEVLLLTYDGPDETVDDSNQYVQQDGDKCPTPDEANLQNKKKRRGKSRMFRVFVKPILPWIRRKKNKAAETSAVGDFELI